MLTLPITLQWYDMILSGEKTEEYREVKPYYDSRFRRLFDMDESNNPTGLDEHPILFRNGYSHTSELHRHLHAL